MKKIFYLLTLLSFWLVSCQEVNDLIQLYPPPGVNDQLVLDSTYTTNNTSIQQKRVLIEDYTGDMCDNCPNAQTQSINIENANPGLISVIGIHCTSLAAPWPGYPDYRTANGTQLMSYFFGIGGPSSLPTGDIDRKIQTITSPPSFSVPYSIWPFCVDSELILTPKAGIAFSYKNYDSSSRTLNMTFTTSFNKASTDTFYVSAAVIESGFKGKQELPTSYNNNFVFEHVLRKLMSPYNGLKIASSPALGATYNVKFQTVLDPSWNADSCKVVAFVHHRSPGNNTVEQVQETTVK